MYTMTVNQYKNATGDSRKQFKKKLIKLKENLMNMQNMEEGLKKREKYKISFYTVFRAIRLFEH